MTKEHPILFSSEMVRAILAGKKTQTRRVLKPQPSDIYSKALNVSGNIWAFQKPNQAVEPFIVKCPYGQVGDWLWVREKWATEAKFDKLSWAGIADTRVATVPIWYAVEDTQIDRPGQVRGRWRFGRFMPRYASRITLEITGIRVERVQDITEADAIAEGVEALYKTAPRTFGAGYIWTPQGYTDSYKKTWDSINGKKYSWASNPYVWVIEFKKSEAVK
jgi:hypothetical protein